MDASQKGEGKERQWVGGYSPLEERQLGPNIPGELGPFSLQSSFHCQATLTCTKPIEPQVLPTVPKRKALDSARNAGAASSHCLGHFDHRHKSWELRNHSEPQLGAGELVNQGNILCNRILYFLLHLQA